MIGFHALAGSLGVDLHVVVAGETLGAVAGGALAVVLCAGLAYFGGGILEGRDGAQLALEVEHDAFAVALALSLYQLFILSAHHCISSSIIGSSSGSCVSCRCLLASLRVGIEHMVFYTSIAI